MREKRGSGRQESGQHSSSQGLTFTQTLTTVMEGLFHPLSFCLVYLDNDAKQTHNEAGDRATIYATVPTRKSPGYPDITLRPGSQGFPNSENPTLQCTRT